MQELATVLLSHTGPVPNLTAIRCHREDRRVQLLLWHCSARTMAGMVRVAARLAAEGCSPGPRNKSEFIARCAEAVRQVAPQAETVLQNLSAEEQASIRRSLGGARRRRKHTRGA